MTDRQCAKCGCTTIAGPRYVAGSFGLRESLRYACTRCGYAWSEPTCDVATLTTRFVLEHATSGGRHE